LPRPKFHHSSPFEYLTADTLLEVVSKRWRKQSTLVTNYLFDSDEEGLAAVISRMGPFIALRDLEDSRDFEAVRCNSTDNWRPTVVKWMHRSQIVLVRIDPICENWRIQYGDTTEYRYATLRLAAKRRPEEFIASEIPDGIWWKLEQLKHLNVERILIYIPFQTKSADERQEIYRVIRKRITDRLSCSLPEAIGAAEFIAFRPDGNAYLINGPHRRFLGINNRYGPTLRPFLSTVTDRAA